MKTQREFIKAVLNQTMKASNLTKINQLLDIAKNEVETNLSWDVIKDYIPALLEFNAENLRTGQLPGSAQYCNNLSFIIVNEAEAKLVVEDLFLKEPEENAEGGNNIDANVTEGIDRAEQEKPNSQISLEVLNGTGVNSKLTTVVTQLQNQGYKVSKKGTTNITKKTVIIDRRSNSTKVQSAIKSLLGVGRIETGEDTNGVDFTIIIGQDY